MKRIFVWFALASFAVAAAVASCSINRRSGQFECEDTEDCEPGRVCSEGLCVSTSVPPDATAKKDAALPDAASACPPQCTQCLDSKVCLINCAAPSPTANCNNPIVCPAGFNCDIRCNVGNACRAGINCTSAASCTISCSGQGSCQGVVCGPGRCNVNCTGQGSCTNVNCSTSCACDVRSCSFTNGSCQAVTCPAQCSIFSGGCTSSRTGCNDC